jgi:hypothetical protein
VTRLRAFFAVALALVWAPVTSHCLFEKLPGFDFLSCCTHNDAAAPHGDDDCSNDACATVEQGFYKLKDNGDIVPQPGLAIAFFLDAVALQVTVKDSGGEAVRTARPPPHLAPAWQFFYRAAVPVRAPSLA